MNRTNSDNQKCAVALACLWCAGLCSGLSVVYYASDSFTSLMRPAVYSRVSIVGLLGGSVLPFLMSFFAFRLSKPRLIFAVCFLRSALFGFCACGLLMTYGSAGWLIQGLMMGSDLLTLPFLFWFWLRHLGGEIRKLNRDFCICVAAAVAFGLLEYILIVPFLARIVTF